MKQTIFFNDHQVRVIVEPNQTKWTDIWFCVFDILKIVKRPQMQTTHGLFSLCPSYCKMQFEDKSLNFIKQRDVEAILALVKNENGCINKTCRLLGEWLKTVPELINNPQTVAVPQDPSIKNDIQIFNNPTFGNIRVAGSSEFPLFCLADVCKILDLRQGDVRQRLTDGVVSTQPITDSMGRVQQANFVNEDGLYDVILDSRKPEARQFRKWVTSDVLPSIRKHGIYMTNEAVEKALTSPDFLIQLANQIKEERAMRFEVEQKVKQLEDSNNYKSDVIEGLTSQIPLADMRQRVSQIVKKSGIDEKGSAWRVLYEEFERKYHMNILTRMRNSNYKGSKVEYIDSELNMLPQLYELCCKIFEGSYKQLMEDWSKSIKRPTK